jgi:hypothetical protein
MIFRRSDPDRERPPRDEAMVITLAIANTFVSRLLIDTGSSVDVLMYDAFIEMGLADSQMYPCWDPLTGFGGDVKPMGCI